MLIICTPVVLAGSRQYDLHSSCGIQRRTRFRSARPGGHGVSILSSFGVFWGNVFCWY